MHKRARVRYTIMRILDARRFACPTNGELLFRQNAERRSALCDDLRSPATIVVVILLKKGLTENRLIDSSTITLDMTSSDTSCRKLPRKKYVENIAYDGLGSNFSRTVQARITK